MFNSRLRHPAALALVGMAGWFGLVSGASAAQLHRSGKAVVEEVCIKCHGPGTDGAPRIGNRADWTPRAKDGLHRGSDP